MGIEIITYSEPVKVNKYAGIVAELVAAGENAAVTITEPTREESTRERAIFGAAAREAGFSAVTRETIEDTDKNGNITAVRVIVSLRDKITRARKGKPVEGEEASVAEATGE